MFRFRECREMRGHTQKYVALSLGVKTPSVSDWERGKTNPTLDNLVALSKLLEVSTDMLLGIDPVVPDVRSDDDLDRLEHGLVEDFRSLNKQGKEYILQTMAMAVTIYKNRIIPDLENFA